jgi:hypothetical protein
MAASAFSPPGFHPVLEGSKRDEDPMVSPGALLQRLTAGRCECLTVRSLRK